jgi:hypothetical protein
MSVTADMVEVVVDVFGEAVTVRRNPSFRGHRIDLAEKVMAPLK